MSRTRAAPDSTSLRAAASIPPPARRNRCCSPNPRCCWCVPRASCTPRGSSPRRMRACTSRRSSPRWTTSSPRTCPNREGRPELIIVALLFLEGAQFLVHAAERLQVAVAAGGQFLLRIDARFACGEALGDPAEVALPGRHQPGPGFGRNHAGNFLFLRREAGELHFADAQRGEGHGGDVLLRADDVERQLRLV